MSNFLWIQEKALHAVSFLAAATLILACGTLIAQDADGRGGVHVLGTDAGVAISKAIRSPEMADKLKGGLEILSVEVSPDHVSIEIAGPEPGRIALRLRHPSSGAGHMGGRWFSFEAQSELPEVLDAVYGIAAVIDGAMERSPWTNPRESFPSRAPVGDGDEDRAWQWIALSLVALEFLVILGFSVAAFNYLRRAPR